MVDGLGHGHGKRYQELNNRMNQRLQLNLSQFWNNPSLTSASSVSSSENIGNMLGGLLAMGGGVALTAVTQHSTAKAQETQLEQANFSKTTGGATSALTSFNSAKNEYDLASKKLENLEKRKENITTGEGETESAKETELKNESARLKSIGEATDNASAIKAYSDAEKSYKKLVSLKAQAGTLCSTISNCNNIIKDTTKEVGGFKGGINKEGLNAFEAKAGKQSSGEVGKGDTPPDGIDKKYLLAQKQNDPNPNYKDDGSTPNEPKTKTVTHWMINTSLYESDKANAEQADANAIKIKNAEDAKSQALAKLKNLDPKIEVNDANGSTNIDTLIKNAEAEMNRLGTQGISGDSTILNAKQYVDAQNDVKKQSEQIKYDKANSKALDKEIEAQKKIVEAKKEAITNAKAKLSQERSTLSELRTQMSTVSQAVSSNQASADNLKAAKNYDNEGDKRTFLQKVFGSNKQDNYKATKKAHKANTTNMREQQANFASNNGFSFNTVRMAEVDAKIAAIDKALADDIT